MSDQTNPSHRHTDDPPRLYTVGELTRVLHLSQAKVRALIRSGALSAIRLGAEWRVTAEDLEAFLAARRVQPNQRRKR